MSTGTNVLTVTDKRTGKTLEIPIENNSINSIAFKEFGLKCYDPGYVNTAVCKSSVCRINGEKGELYYRGYSIEDLVENSSYLEVAYLLIHGQLPTQNELDVWTARVMKHTFIHEDITKQIKCSRYNSHPQSILVSALTAMGSYYRDANSTSIGVDTYSKDANIRTKQIFRILGKLPTLAAYVYRHRIGRPYNTPSSSLNYIENFLYMLDRLSESEYRPHPVLVRALEKLWIIHAEHGLNCSTATMRQLCSTKVEPFAAISGAALALYGPLHGGANEAALNMLHEIGTTDNVADFLAAVKRKEKKLMGFGHRIYKTYDPRAFLVKKVADEVFELLGNNPLMDVALELEKQAMNDEYFVKRQLAPNVDFYSGLIYHAMGFQPDMFPVLFTIPRVVGWLAHWVESLDPSVDEQRLFRPQQIYTGPMMLKYTPISERTDDNEQSVLNEIISKTTGLDTRRVLSEIHRGGDMVYSIPKTARKSLEAVHEIEK